MDVCQAYTRSRLHRTNNNSLSHNVREFLYAAVKNVQIQNNPTLETARAFCALKNERDYAFTKRSLHLIRNRKYTHNAIQSAKTTTMMTKKKKKQKTLARKW